MSNLLSLFIEPPYDAWTKNHGYGEEKDGVVTDHISLTADPAQVSNLDKLNLLAACPGVLSVHPPSTGPQPHSSYYVDLLTTDPMSETITLYLHLTPLAAFEPVLTKRVNELQHIKPPVTPFDLTEMKLIGFVYYNVDTASLLSSIEDLLNQSILAHPSITNGVNLDDRKNMFVQGNLPVFVKKAGCRIGLPGLVLNDNTNTTTRQVGFGVLTNLGTWDPSHLYHELNDILLQEDPKKVQGFKNLLPLNWPIIPQNLDVAAATENILYPIELLEMMRRSHNLTGTEWREVGNNQKALFRKQLQARTGNLKEGDTTPHFNFNILDKQNLFQLEAVVEFYANFPDPWATGTTPRESTDSNYITVDFLQPEGSDATLALFPRRDTLSLGSDKDLKNLIKNTVQENQKNPHQNDKKNGDIIVIWPNNNPDQKSYYRIIKINGLDVTVDSDINVTVDSNINDTGPFEWRILRRPILVLIDSFAGRIRGDKATANSSTITLDITEPNLRHVNQNFDTIYLSNVKAGSRSCFRIKDINVAAKTLTLDGTPDLESTTSSWHIPAGLSEGGLPQLSYYIGPDMARPGQPPYQPPALGNDHYDGVMFIIYDGSAQGPFRWSSYTSRYRPNSLSQEGKRKACSSVRGNRRYYYHSWRAHSKEIINFAFHIGKSSPPGHFNKNIPARNYFGYPNIGVDQGCTLDGDHKGDIFIHYGSKGLRSTPRKGSGSLGCLVSPLFSNFRDYMIEIMQQEIRHLISLSGYHFSLTLQDDQEFQELYNQLTELNKLVGKNLRQSRTFFDHEINTDWDTTNWNDKLIGDFWLIRPDERPLD